jgi:hypothetical protein
MREDVRSVVLWDPVVNGNDYVEERIAAQGEAERWFLTPKRRRPGEDNLNLLGFPLTPAMRGSIEAIGPAQYEQPTRASVSVFYSDVPPAAEQLHRALRTGGTPFRTEMMLGQPPWRESKTIVNGGLPFAVIERMVETLT